MSSEVSGQKQSIMQRADDCANAKICPVQANQQTRRTQLQRDKRNRVAGSLPGRKHKYAESFNQVVAVLRARAVLSGIAWRMRCHGYTEQFAKHRGQRFGGDPRRTSVGGKAKACTIAPGIGAGSGKYQVPRFTDGWRRLFARRLASGRTQKLHWQSRQDRAEPPIDAGTLRRVDDGWRLVECRRRPKLASDYAADQQS